MPVKPQLPPINDPAEFPTLASMAAEAPYRLPALIDFNHLKAIIAAKRLDAAEHIWALREDPGYLSDILKEWSSHRLETLLDTNGAKHPILDRPLFWDRVVSNVIVDAYGSLAVWDALQNELASLAVLQVKYRKSISPEEKLPPEYMKALLAFRYLLDQASKGPILTLKNGVPASAPLRSLFIRDPQVPGSTMINVRTKRNTGQDPLMWIFNTLWDDHTLFLVGLPNLMDELERLVQSDPKQKEKLSPWVANVASDLGVIARAWHEIDLYQPWAAAFDHGLVDYKEEIERGFSKKVEALAKVHGAFQGISLAKVGDPSDGRFSYPSDKRRTKKTTDAMRKAEENLDSVWQIVDQFYEKKTRSTLSQLFRHLFPQSRRLERTPEWVEPIKKPKEKAEINDHERVQEGLSKLSLPPKEPFQTVVTVSTNKVKTRGEAVVNSAPVVEPPPQQKDIQPTISVSTRAMKVFKTLFHSPSQSDLPGETAWTDFLYAMASSGFAPQKLYGSV